MTNPILELLRADKYCIAEVAMQAQGPIKAFIRDYAKAVEALKKHDRWHRNTGVMLVPEGQLTEDGWKDGPMEINIGDEYLESSLAEITATALATAETHQELLQAVREEV